MSGDWLRWVLGIVVIAHGVGHVLFMPLLRGALRLETDGRSWLVGPVLGDGPTTVLASMLAGLAAAAFVAAGVGLIGLAAWWRVLAVGAAVLSMVVIVALWNGVPTSSAAFALAFDVVILVALVVVHWPSAETIGA
jgi:hypothetical protein